MSVATTTTFRVVRFKPANVEWGRGLGDWVTPLPPTAILHSYLQPPFTLIPSYTPLKWWSGGLLDSSGSIQCQYAARRKERGKSIKYLFAMRKRIHVRNLTQNAYENILIEKLKINLKIFDLNSVVIFGDEIWIYMNYLESSCITSYVYFNIWRGVTQCCFQRPVTSRKINSLVSAYWNKTIPPERGDLSSFPGAF